MYTLFYESQWFEVPFLILVVQKLYIQYTYNIRSLHKIEIIFLKSCIDIANLFLYKGNYSI